MKNIQEEKLHIELETNAGRKVIKEEAGVIGLFNAIHDK